MTLRQVETAVGISNAYLSQLESGKIKRPAPVILQRLCGLYGASYADALLLAGHPIPSEVERDTTPSSVFARRLGSISDEEADSLLEYLAFLRSREVR